MNCVNIQFPSFPPPPPPSPSLPSEGDLNARTNFKDNMCLFSLYFEIILSLFYLWIFFRGKFHNLLHKA